MTRGRLIVLEGSEGAGKTTQLRLLSARLAARGVPSASFQEPGGTPLGQEIRRMVLDPSRQISPGAEALLFLASRAQLVAYEILPRLAVGDVVLLDRFVLSTYAYQVAGRELPEAAIRHANALAVGALVPDLTILLTVPSDTARARAARRGGADRMERAGAAFHDRVAQAFAAFVSPHWQRVHPECGPVIAVDGTGSEDEVLERLVEVLADRWPATFSSLSGSYRSDSPRPRF